MIRLGSNLGLLCSQVKQPFKILHTGIVSDVFAQIGTYFDIAEAKLIKQSITANDVKEVRDRVKMLLGSVIPDPKAIQSQSSSFADEGETKVLQEWLTAIKAFTMKVTSGLQASMEKVINFENTVLHQMLLAFDHGLPGIGVEVPGDVEAKFSVVKMALNSRLSRMCDTGLFGNKDGRFKVYLPFAAALAQAGDDMDKLVAALLQAKMTSGHAADCAASSVILAHVRKFLPARTVTVNETEVNSDWVLCAPMLIEVAVGLQTTLVPFGPSVVEALQKKLADAAALSPVAKGEVQNELLSMVENHKALSALADQINTSEEEQQQQFMYWLLL